LEERVFLSNDMSPLFKDDSSRIIFSPVSIENTIIVVSSDMSIADPKLKDIGFEFVLIFVFLIGKTTTWDSFACSILLFLSS
jgi:hypothetical protein